MQYKTFGKVHCSNIYLYLKCDIRVVRNVNRKILSNESVLIEYKERQKLKLTRLIRDYIESYTFMNRKASSYLIPTK